MFNPYWIRKPWPPSPQGCPVFYLFSTFRWKQSLATPQTKVCSEMALGLVTRNSCKMRAIVITLGTVTYILEQMLDKVQTAFTA